jgi:hypothetical protein
VFAFLFTVGALLLRERLKITDLLVQGREVLLDDECELVDLDRSVVE